MCTYIYINRYLLYMCITKQSERSKRLGSTVRVGYSRLKSDIVGLSRLQTVTPICVCSQLCTNLKNKCVKISMRN